MTSQCKHHESYDPSSGEPTTRVEQSQTWVTRPCPYCWQAYACHLNQRILDEQSAFDKMEELFLQGQEGFRVLEGQLADEKAAHEKYRKAADKRWCHHHEAQIEENSQHIDYVNETHKREAKLVEALEFYADEYSWTRLPRFAVESVPKAVKDSGDKARAALAEGED